MYLLLKCLFSMYMTLHALSEGDITIINIHHHHHHQDPWVSTALLITFLQSSHSRSAIIKLWRSCLHQSRMSSIHSQLGRPLPIHSSQHSCFYFSTIIHSAYNTSKLLMLQCIYWRFSFMYFILKFPLSVHTTFLRTVSLQLSLLQYY